MNPRAINLCMVALLLCLLSAALFNPLPTASEARLVGLCNGKILAAMEEDQFPYGCEQIVPISAKGATFKEPTK